MSKKSTLSLNFSDIQGANLPPENISDQQIEQTPVAEPDMMQRL